MYLMYRGLWDAQPLVTFGERPSDAQLQHGRDVLAVACGVTVAGGAVVALSGRWLEGLLLAVPAPAALLLTYVGPANRALGWAGMLLALVALGAAIRTAGAE